MHLCFSGNSTISYGDLVDGTQPSPCPLPCTTTYTYIRLLAEYPRVYNNSQLDITFSNQMKVTTTSFLPFHLSSLLSDLGGSMGLWLGLGVVQARQLVLVWVLPAIRSRA